MLVKILIPFAAADENSLGCSCEVDDCEAPVTHVLRAIGGHYVSRVCHFCGDERPLCAEQEVE